MERVIERFDMYMEYKGLNHLHISGYRLQKQFGLSSGTVTNWRKNVNNPRDAFLNRFCDTYHINKVWLLTGEGSMYAYNLSDLDKDFLTKIDNIKSRTGLTNKEIALELGVYGTFISELRAGKTTVRPELMELLRKEFGYVYDDLEAEKEILELKMEISRIKEFLGMK